LDRGKKKIVEDKKKNKEGKKKAEEEKLEVKRKKRNRIWKGEGKTRGGTAVTGLVENGLNKRKIAYWEKDWGKKKGVALLKTSRSENGGGGWVGGMAQGKKMPKRTSEGIGGGRETFKRAKGKMKGRRGGTDDGGWTRKRVCLDTKALLCDIHKKRNYKQKTNKMGESQYGRSRVRTNKKKVVTLPCVTETLPKEFGIE